MKIIIISLLIFFSACSMHHIQYNQKKSMEISLDNISVLQTNTKILYENRVNLSTVNIEQSVLQTQQGDILTFEDATVQSGYKFSYGVNRTVGIIFSAYNYDIVDTKGNIYFIILSKKDDRLYLILENMNKKRLKIVYGFKEDDFNKILEKIVHNKKMLIENKSNKQILKKDKKLYIQSNWNMKNIIIDTIVYKDGGSKILR